jgi:hypothetical protein
MTKLDQHLLPPIGRVAEMGLLLLQRSLHSLLLGLYPVGTQSAPQFLLSLDSLNQTPIRGAGKIDVKIFLLL